MPLAELAGRLEINPWTYFVLTTRGVDIDVPGLPALLASPAAYIGVIGSRGAGPPPASSCWIKASRKKLLDESAPRSAWSFNAETPEEIAVSILAEIIHAARRGGA